jgi:hypothetical protein
MALRSSFVLHSALHRLEELYIERSYLLNNVQQETLKVMELLRKLSSLEETMVRSQSSKARRRARKQTAWLRYRINLATCQQRTILNRLGQLAQEIGSSEQRNQLHSEQLSTLSSTEISYYGIQQISCSPLSPESYIQESFFPLIPTQQPQCENGGISRPWVFGHVSQMPSDKSSPLSPTACHGANWAIGIDTQTRAVATPTSESLSRGQRSSSINSLDLKLLSTNMRTISISDRKRHSTGSYAVLKL